MGINIKSSNNRLQLVFTVSSQRYYLSLGLPDNAKNRKVAQGKVVEIERDITLGIFDDTLNRYRPNYKPPKEPNLKELWEKYEQFRQPLVAETTFRVQYRVTRNHIARLPTHRLKDAPKIRAHLVANFTPGAAKATLTQINAACKWGMRTGLLQDNPFQHLTKDVKVPKKSKIHPFSKEEMDTIIAAFAAHPRWRHYAPLVKFLFWTGCRTGEAFALQWKHISPDCSRIRFEQSCSTSLGILKGTKNHKNRVFPCSPKLQELLRGMARGEPESLVFLNAIGEPMKQSHFNHNVWGGYIRQGREFPGLVKRLVSQRLIEAYRPQYNTRHTFATLALQSGLSVPDVAQLIGDTPEVVLRNYAGARRNLVAPDI